MLTNSFVHTSYVNEIEMDERKTKEYLFKLASITLIARLTGCCTIFIDSLSNATNYKIKKVRESYSMSY